MVINKMTVEVLCIGDPHFQVDNIPEVDLFTEKILNLAKEKLPQLIVILGDTLHTHERLHTIPFNKANDLIYQLSTIALTYVLVGNHRSEREPTGSINLKSGAHNFWKMEGAQKVTFSIQNLYSQMHFRSQMCPERGSFGGI